MFSNLGIGVSRAVTLFEECCLLVKQSPKFALDLVRSTRKLRMSYYDKLRHLSGDMQSRKTGIRSCFLPDFSRDAQLKTKRSGEEVGNFLYHQLSCL